MNYSAQVYPVPLAIVTITAAQCGDLQPFGYSHMQRWQLFAFTDIAAVHVKLRFSDNIHTQCKLPVCGAEFVVEGDIEADLHQLLGENPATDVISVPRSLVEFSNDDARARFKYEFSGLLRNLFLKATDLRGQCEVLMEHAQRSDSAL